MLHSFPGPDASALVATGDIIESGTVVAVAVEVPAVVVFRDEGSGRFCAVASGLLLLPPGRWSLVSAESVTACDLGRAEVVPSSVVSSPPRVLLVDHHEETPEAVLLWNIDLRAVRPGDGAFLRIVNGSGGAGAAVVNLRDASAGFLEAAIMYAGGVVDGTALRLGLPPVAGDAAGYMPAFVTLSVECPETFGPAGSFVSVQFCAPSGAVVTVPSGG